MNEPGHMEVICGCMFSGKTSALMDRIAEARSVRKPVYAFKHACDTRYEERCICAHSGQWMDALPVKSASELRELVSESGLIAIDEGQFFDESLLDVSLDLVKQGHRVVVAGLDLDCWGLPFDVMSELIARADRVRRLEGVCTVCGRPANRTQRIAPITDESMVGGSVAYEPRCAACFVAPPLALRR